MSSSSATVLPAEITQIIHTATSVTTTTTTTTTQHHHFQSTATSLSSSNQQPVPSFQDLTDSSGDEDDEDQDWDDLVNQGTSPPPPILTIFAPPHLSVELRARELIPPSSSSVSRTQTVKAAFTHDQIEEMMHYLKERGLFAFMRRFVDIERVPVKRLLLAFGVLVPPELDGELAAQLRMLKVACSKVLRNRDKLDEYNTVTDAISLISESKRILVLTGAGVSTSCGIPDFRSPTGLYARLREENWDLDDPQQMFDLDYFKEKPNVFYSFAKEIYPSNFTPSPCHCFVKVLEKNEKLLRNYTQNIDGLFEKVGVERILNCHGSFATASCLRCRTRFPGSAIESDVFASRVPLCPLCTKQDEEIARAKAASGLLEASSKKKGKKKAAGGGWNEDSTSDEDDDDFGMDRGEWDGKPLVKPDIVFFGEMLSDEFDRRLLEDRENVDLLIVIGTSLRVSPVAQIVSHLPHSIPQILINRDPVTHANFDIHLLGDGDTIVRYLAERLGGEFDLDGVLAKKEVEVNGEREGQVEAAAKEKKKTTADVVPERVGDSHVWLFPGANREHAWVGAVRRAFGGEEEGESSSEEEPVVVAKPVSKEPGSDSEGSEVTQSDESQSEEEEEEEDDGKKELAGLRVPFPENGFASRSRSRSPESDEVGPGVETKRFKIE